MSKIELLLLIVFLLLLILLFKYLQTKRQIRNLSKQIAELVNGKSEKMLDISLIDKDLEQLAGILNQYNDNQRQLIASTLRHENYLKESIANISHDLRTPLTVILGHLQLLRKETLTDKQEQRIETIFHKAERMKELVQTFYDLSILDAEQITPRREDFNLSNLLINLITENAPALEAKNISPEIDLPPHSVYLNSDYSMVERILQNLLTNAIRYSSGDIKMGLKQTRKNRAIFTIENPIDSKTEINPARLFERFYTGDASRHNSGTGVGLAVVKLLTDKLGGNVSAEIKSNVLTKSINFSFICRTMAKEKKPSYGGKQYSLQGAGGTASGSAEYTNAYRSNVSIPVVHCSSFRGCPPGAALSSHRKGYLRWSSYRQVCC